MANDINLMQIYSEIFNLYVHIHDDFNNIIGLVFIWILILSIFKRVQLFRDIFFPSSYHISHLLWHFDERWKCSEATRCRSSPSHAKKQSDVFCWSAFCSGTWPGLSLACRFIRPRISLRHSFYDKCWSITRNVFSLPTQSQISALVTLLYEFLFKVSYR